MLGYTRDELLKRTWSELTYPDDLVLDETPFNKLLDGTLQFYSLTKRFIRKDGSLIFTNLYANAVRTPSRQVEYVTAMIEDITDRTKAKQALLESQQIYQDLVQTIEGIVWECDFPSFQVTFVSQYAKQLLGYPLQQWHDDPQFLGNMILSDDRQRILDYCYQTSLIKNNHIMEYRVPHANGSILWLRDQVTVIVKDDQPVKLRGIMVDITEQKKTESELQESE